MKLARTISARRAWWITGAAGASAAVALTGLLSGCNDPGGGNGRSVSAELNPISVASAATPTPSASAAASPLVQTPATNSAAAIQNAFEQVAKAADPAVVTITTLQRVPQPRGMGGFGGPFGGPGGNGGSDGSGNDPLDQFFRQFQRQFNQQFGGDGSDSGGGGGGGGAQPQSFSLPGAPSAGAAPGSGSLYRVQNTRRRGGGGGGGGGPLIGVGLGSGFIYRSDGLILTNAHVVAGADRVTVKLSDGREFQNAQVLGQDARTDIAVVKIPADNLPTLPTGDSSGVHVGDWAIAVGNPYGLDRTLTVGVISATNRQVPISDNGPGNYLQTDASINPGNSGGPLLDINGRVIGINDAIYSQTGSSIGIGFAVPVDTARQIADILVQKGHVSRAYMGVAITDVDDQAAAFGLPAGTKGALVETVSPSGPAAQAGIQPGDVVTALNGQPITTSSDLQQRISGSPIGSTATLTVLRHGHTVSIPVHLAELKEPGATGKTGSNATAGEPTQLGIRLMPLTPDVASQLGVHAGTTGVVVAGTEQGSPAQIAGLQAGDIIERVGQTPVTTPEQVKSEVAAILQREPADQKSVALYVNRHGQRSYVIVTL